MTSEIAILNKAAVAVAADSAVTVGKAKVHKSANKIFVISETTPIGAMIHGFADYAGLPWETIIKLFRKEHGNKNFDTVKSCAEKFLEHIKQDRYITEDASAISIGLLASSLANELSAALAPHSSRERSRKIGKEVASRISELDTDNKINPKFNVSTKAQFRKDHRDLIFNVFKDILSDIGYSIPQRMKNPLSDFVRAALFSSYISDYSSGVVFFGFGSNEIMPSLVSYRIDGVPLKQVRCVIDNDIDIERNRNEVVMVPFADRDIMDVFMEGINSEMKAFFLNLMEYTANEVADHVIKNNFTTTQHQYKTIKHMNKKLISDLMNDFAISAKAYVYETSISKVIDVVKGMPKEDMATLAEALVEVTALKKKVTFGVESVGGPVDVALVTKGDGLIWIKRKHYFELEKNLHFLYHRFGSILGNREH